MRRPTSYFWALHADPAVALSDQGSSGLEYARQLARVAQLRSAHVLEHRPLIQALTINELAELSGVSPATVRCHLKAAREELFGALTDSGIRYRLRRQRQLQERPARRCHQHRCTNLIPSQASAARHYCDPHRTPNARVKRHRRRHPTPRPK